MKKRYFLVSIIFLIFFSISFLTNILGAINPNVSDSYSLSGTMTGLLPFSFFIAYGLMSIPSGMIVQKIGERKSITGAWILGFAGSLLFSLKPEFPVFLFSLFLIGSGMAMLQVSCYALLRVAGGEEHFAFNNIIAQLVFGLASFVSPFVYSWLVLNLDAGNTSGIFKFLSSVVPDNLPWVSMYWVFVVVCLILVITVSSVRFPKITRKEDEIVGAWKTHAELFGQRIVILFFFGIFSYVAVEQGIANWISEFLRTYHDLPPETTGARTVGLFWGMMTLGCIPGLFLLRIMDSKIVLRMFTVAALVILVLTLFGSREIALIGFPALGFCLSAMYGIIFSLALNSVDRFHGSFSGILCTAIAGGAVFSLLIGKLKDVIGLKPGMLVLYIPLVYILSLSFWAKPLVSNKTIKRQNTNE